MKLMEDSTGFITATSMNTKGMVPEVIKTRTPQLDTLTGPKVKRVRHNRTNKCIGHELNA